MGILTGLKQASGLLQRPSARRTKELLSLNRNQFQWMVERYFRTQSRNRTPFKMGLTDIPICERCLQMWNGHTHLVQVWCHGLFKISSPGTLFYGTRWLSWRLCKQIFALHSKCRAVQELNRGVRTIEHETSWCRGQQLDPFLMHVLVYVQYI
jgi:hypothetical protein